MRLLIVLLLAAAVTADFQSIKYKNCKSKLTVKDVQIDGCDVQKIDGKEVCVFKAGTSPQMRIQFENTADGIDKMVMSVKAKVNDALLKFPTSNDDACEFGGLSCPLAKGDHTYTQAIDILAGYPKDTTIQINWMLNRGGDEAARDVCIVFLGRITQ